VPVIGKREENGKTKGINVQFLLEVTCLPGNQLGQALKSVVRKKLPNPIFGQLGKLFGYVSSNLYLSHLLELWVAELPEWILQ